MRYFRLVVVAISLLFALPYAVQAGPPIIATVVTPGCKGSQAILTVTLNKTTSSFYSNNGGLYYQFDHPIAKTIYTNALSPFVVPITYVVAQGTSFASGTSHNLWISTNKLPTNSSSSSADYPFVVPFCKVPHEPTWEPK
jgi:hypothetical protein